MEIGQYTSTSQASQSASERGRKSLSDSFDNFMLLLTTQLQNQDPTEPLDVNQMTQQIAMLTQVEQQVASNRYLEQMINLNIQDQVGTSVTYIGREVQASGNTGVLKDGKASFYYELPGEAEAVTLSIIDQRGGVVFSSAGSTQAGLNEVKWDGTNMIGNKLNDGVYRLVVNASTANDETLDPSYYTRGIVRAVSFENGNIVLNVDDQAIPLDRVVSIGEPETADAGSEETAATTE